MQSKYLHCLFYCGIFSLIAYSCYQLFIAPTLIRIKIAKQPFIATYSNPLPIKPKIKSINPQSIIQEEQHKKHLFLINFNSGTLVKVTYQSTFVTTKEIIKKLLQLSSCQFQNLSIKSNSGSPLLETELICEPGNV